MISKYVFGGFPIETTKFHIGLLITGLVLSTISIVNAAIVIGEYNDLPVAMGFLVLFFIDFISFPALQYYETSFGSTEQDNRKGIFLQRVLDEFMLLSTAMKLIVFISMFFILLFVDVDGFLLKYFLVCTMINLKYAIMCLVYFYTLKYDRKFDEDEFETIHHVDDDPVELPPIQ